MTRFLKGCLKWWPTVIPFVERVVIVFFHVALFALYKYLLDQVFTDMVYVPLILSLVTHIKFKINYSQSKDGNKTSVHLTW